MVLICGSGVGGYVGCRGAVADVWVGPPWDVYQCCVYRLSRAFNATKGMEGVWANASAKSVQVERSTPDAGQEGLPCLWCEDQLGAVGVP